MLAGLVLQNQAAWRALGDLETRLLARRLGAVRLDRPVFIAGLARAGTTILLRKISDLPGFVSHRYADFPFLFTPYAWSKLRRPTRQAPRERMHQDRIMVTDESPEAMEEVLWAAFFPELDAAPSQVLDAQTSRPAFEAFFADHIRKLLLARDGRRWVSKNNYNLSRLSYLARIIPDARFLIPVRDPAAHVASLMKQHALFSRVQRESEAARTHLRQVRHFEFGLDRRPIALGDTAAIEACWARGEEARGWAKYWALTYGHVLDRLAHDDSLAARALIVSYERLCDPSSATLSAVCRHIGAEEPPGLADGLAPPDYYVPGFTPGEIAAISEETEPVARRLRQVSGG